MGIRRKARRYGMIAVPFLLAVGVAAGAGIAARTSAQTTKVTVKETEYKIAVGKLRTGKTTFVVTNAGKVPHQFSISGPGIGTKHIPGTIAPGKTKTLTVTLKSGTYKLWCPIHVALGMKTSVKTGGGSSSSSGGTTTGSGSAWG